MTAGELQQLVNSGILSTEELRDCLAGLLNWIDNSNYKIVI